MDEALMALQRGWGDQFEENLRLAVGVFNAYDDSLSGALDDEYLQRTGLGNDPRIIRLAARTGRKWLEQGWRP
jgi:hypothetical protein